jgi:hypothetical protein
MTENQAEKEGLSFTGIYSHDKDCVKTCIVEERKKCPGARIVLVLSPSSPLSRRHQGGGYSAYGDDTYQAYKTIEMSTPFIKSHTIALQRAMDIYKKAVANENKVYAYHDKLIQQAQETIKQTLNKPKTTTKE